jgi:hypothetical protein
MRDRLTDEKWRKMLSGKEAPKPVPWAKEYAAAKGSYVCAARGGDE